MTRPLAIALPAFGACLGALLLAGCAGGGRPAAIPPDALHCPPNEVVVCRGGTVSKTGNASRRDRRFCDCRPVDRVNR